MKRRTFIASLVALPAVCVAAAKACVKPVGLNLDDIIEAVQQLKSNRSDVVTVWLQTPRLGYSCTMEYEDAMDAVFTTDTTTLRKNWHERRKERSRSNMASLKTQRPLPLP